MLKDPLAGTVWSEAGTVTSFAQSSPNQTLMCVAARQIARGHSHLLDIGCGAGRNAIPLAHQGWSVTGVDFSFPMLQAATARGRLEVTREAPRFVLAPMEQLPIRSSSVEFIVAHGVWNLARSTAQFRGAVREAARVARPGAVPVRVHLFEDHPRRRCDPCRGRGVRVHRVLGNASVLSDCPATDQRAGQRRVRPGFSCAFNRVEPPGRTCAQNRWIAGNLGRNFSIWAVGTVRLERTSCAIPYRRHLGARWTFISLRIAMKRQASWPSLQHRLWRVFFPIAADYSSCDPPRRTALHAKPLRNPGVPSPGTAVRCLPCRGHDDDLQPRSEVIRNQCR
jgi:SAM-dependent methyltransferase